MNEFLSESGDTVTRGYLNRFNEKREERDWERISRDKTEHISKYFRVATFSPRRLSAHFRDYNEVIARVCDAMPRYRFTASR